MLLYTKETQTNSYRELNQMEFRCRERERGKKQIHTQPIFSYKQALSQSALLSIFFVEEKSHFNRYMNMNL